MKKLSFIALILLIGAQLAVPVMMIKGREKILRNGELYRFLTRPIDPADPFQGRYVRLAFQNDYVPCSKDRELGLHRNQKIYALIEVGEDGFARFTSWSTEKPVKGRFLATRYLGNKSEWNRISRTSMHKGIRLDIPFDRFYMEEEKAPRAEHLVREAVSSTNCWAEVRILNGRPAIEDVYAQGQSLRELAAKNE